MLKFKSWFLWFIFVDSDGGLKIGSAIYFVILMSKRRFESAYTSFQILLSHVVILSKTLLYVT